MARYLKRIADRELTARMEAMGAVLIEGPKACGKTATASQVAKTIIRVDEDQTARAAITLAPDRLFDQPTPILFDEWQAEPAIWNRVRRQVDDRGGRGLYILTGSATPNDDVNRHSGAGRFGVIQMRPMSLFESQHSNGDVSLDALMNGETQTGDGTHLNFDELLQRIVIGGWPSLLAASEDEARQWLRDYIAQVVEVDVQSLGARRNPRNVRRLLAALARSVGQPVKDSSLATDVGRSDTPLERSTVVNYLDALGRLHLTDNCESWNPHMRSSTRLRTAAVRYFADPSLGPAALDIGSAQLGADLNATGFHFEALAIRDLRIYAQPLRGRVDSWRDANGNEVDAIVSLPDGRWAAFEVKLNPATVDEAAAALLRFAGKVDVDRHGEPAALAVITSTGYAGRRPDGVDVIPIAALGP